jgi:hypothetical protein
VLYDALFVSREDWAQLPAARTPLENGESVVPKPIIFAYSFGRFDNAGARAISAHGESMSNELYKAQAARLVKFLSEHHKFRLKQSTSLEAIAAMHGARDWNTLIARKPEKLTPVSVEAAGQATAAPAFDAWWTRWMPATRIQLTLPPKHLEGADTVSRLAKRSPNDVETQLLTPVQPLSDEELHQVIANDVVSLVMNLGPYLNVNTSNITKRCGWRKGRRLYLLEIKFREYVTAHLAKNSQRVEEPHAGRGPKPITKSLLRSLAEKGWLVTEADGHHMNPEEALWNTQIGRYPFKGVIVVDLPGDMSALLEAQDTNCDVAITGPLFNSTF